MTSKLSTYRLIDKSGVHFGFVVIDEEQELCHINNDFDRAFSPLALFAFARCNDAIIHALNGGGVAVPLRTVGINETFFLTGF